MKRYPELRHSEEGLASISLQGAEFGVTLGRALGMDSTHQVRLNLLAYLLQTGSLSFSKLSTPVPGFRHLVHVGAEAAIAEPHWAAHLAAQVGFITRAGVLNLPCSVQVVGRLSAGRDLLPLLNGLKTDANDAPQHRVKVARCGFTDAGVRCPDAGVCVFAGSWRVDAKFILPFVPLRCSRLAGGLE